MSETFIDEGESKNPNSIQRRQAKLAAVLADAYRRGEIEAQDVLRVIRHELRGLQTNRKLEIELRSTRANEVIQTYIAIGELPPKNSSSEALHADHVWPVTESLLISEKTVEQWMNALSRLGKVVCVTAEENYRLESIERAGVIGPEKYAKAGISIVDRDGNSSSIRQSYRGV
jgi:hypothetical protein